MNPAVREKLRSRLQNLFPIAIAMKSFAFRSAGFEGILSPSAQDRNGKNIVIFLDSLQPKSFVRLLSPENLPPHPSQWPP